LNAKARYVELKTILSETHKEQLDELLAIIRGSSIPLLEGEVEVEVDVVNIMFSSWKEREKRERENKQKKKERVELYEKYLKNKEIQAQIMELEQKINQLKGEIVK